MENFPNPPIQEAVLDIFVSLPSETTLDKLKEINLPFGPRFPKTEERINLMGGIQFNASGETSTTASRQLSGYLFRSSVTDAKAFQARLDGFSFNKLRLYEGWAKFTTEAKELWSYYRSVAKPVLVTRLGLRYINRVEIPLPFRDFADYCPLFPNIPARMPQQLSSFLMSYSMPVEDPPQCVATVILTFEPQLPLARSFLPLILDIGVNAPFGGPPNNDDALWSCFDILRGIKNNIFNSSLTEEAKKLFR